MPILLKKRVSVLLNFLSLALAATAQDSILAELLVLGLLIGGSFLLSGLLSIGFYKKGNYSGLLNQAFAANGAMFLAGYLFITIKAALFCR